MQTNILLHILRTVSKGLDDWAEDIEKKDDLKYVGVNPKKEKLREDILSYENLLRAVRESV